MDLAPGRRDPPDRVADIVGDEQRAAFVDRNADGTAVGLAIGIEKAGENVAWLAGRFAAFERHENDLIAGERLAVPRAVLADEGAIRHLLRKQGAGVEGKPE